MEAKAIKFVKIIRRKLKSDPECQGVQLEKLFLRAVEKLPDGELKSELQGNLPRYRRLVKHKKRVLQQSEHEGLDHSGENVTNSPSEDRKRRAHSLGKKRPPGSIKMGRRADFTGPAELQWLADLRWNVTLTCACAVTNKVLQTTMKLYTSKLAEHLTEDFLCGLRPEGLAILEQDLKRFLHFCNHCYVASEEFKRRPTYHDLTAAMLSVYLDVILLSTRPKDTEDCRRDAKQLVNTAMYLLRHSPGHILDVLLQQTQATPGDGAVILPLYTKALETVNVNRNPALYTKYMLTARQAVDVFKQESATLLERAVQVAAPAGYSEWLCDQNVSLPEMEYVGGVAVSKVLLEECDADTIDLLLDMLTEDTQMTDTRSLVNSAPVDTTDNSKDQDQSEEKIERTTESSLFFIDKDATTLPIELQPSDVDLEQVVEDDKTLEPETQDMAEELLPAELMEDEDIQECLSNGTNSHQDSDDEVILRSVVIGVEGTEDDDTATTQTLAVTPDRRIRTDTKRVPSMKKSPKKSTSKKTPQRETTDVEAGEFTGLRSRSKDLSKPVESRVSDAPMPPGDSDEQTMDDVTQEESDDGSVIIVSSQVARRRSCRIRRRTREVEHAAVEEGIRLREKKKAALKTDTEMADTSDQATSKLPEVALFYIDKKASKMELQSVDEKMDDVTTEALKTNTSDQATSKLPVVALFYIDKKASKIELQSVDEKMEDVKTEVCKDTPKNRRQSGVKRVLSARKSQQSDRSSKKTPKVKNGEVEGNSFTKLQSRHLQPVSLSSPVLASGGKRARKGKDTLTQDDLDDSWVVIDTPDRKSGGSSKCSSAVERIKDEESVLVKGKIRTTPKSAKRELRKSTPLRTPATDSAATPTSTRKRKSLLVGETPKEDISKSGVKSMYSLRRKSTLAEHGSDP